MMRALRTDKITLAALEATVENHFSGMAFKEVPVLRMLSKTPKEIEGLRQQLLSSLSERVRKCIFEVDCESQVGGGSLPSQSLPSRGIAIRVPHVDRLAKLLRLGTPAILGHIADQQLVLDLRTVNSQDLESLAFRINDVLGLYKT